MDDRLRFVGLVTAVGLSASILVVSLAVGRLELVAIGAALGIPIGGLLAWRSSPIVARQSGGAALSTALRLSGQAVLLGDLAVSAILVFANMAAGGSSDAATPVLALLADAVAIPIIGLLVFGLPGYMLAFVVLWPTTLVIRSVSGPIDPSPSIDRAVVR